MTKNPVWREAQNTHFNLL